MGYSSAVRLRNKPIDKQPRMRKDVHLSEGDKQPRIIGHSNGVRLIDNDGTNN
jgi:hypothetical protein